MSFGYQVLGFGSSATVGSGISYGSSAVEIGTIPNAPADNDNQYLLSLSPNFPTSGVVYAIMAFPTNSGAFNVYKSTDASANWSQTISNQAGNGSLYSYGMQAISDTIVVMQHRADLYRSTNSGANFTHIANLNGNESQNNYLGPIWDGTYGMLTSYGTTNYYTSDSFASVTAQTNVAGALMSAAPLSVNGNVFLKAGYGSSGSPKTINTTNNTAATLTNIQTTDSGGIVVASDPHTSNVYFAKTGGKNASSDDDFYYATYPSTTMTAMRSGGTNNEQNGSSNNDVTNHGTMVYGMADGLYYYNIGGSHTRFSTETTVQSVVSLDTSANAIQFVLRNGKVYGIDLPKT